MGAVLITDNERLNCSLSSIGKLRCTLSGSKDLNCKISFAQSAEQPAYPGPYEATPLSSEQIFATKDKTMKQDFAVNPIPYFEVSNEYGTTVNIGG